MIIDFIKVCRVSWPNDPTPSHGGAYAQLWGAALGRVAMHAKRVTSGQAEVS